MTIKVDSDRPRVANACATFLKKKKTSYVFVAWIENTVLGRLGLPMSYRYCAGNPEPRHTRLWVASKLHTPVDCRYGYPAGYGAWWSTERKLRERTLECRERGKGVIRAPGSLTDPTIGPVGKDGAGNASVGSPHRIHLWTVADVQYFFRTQSPERTSAQKPFGRRLKGIDLRINGTQCDRHPLSTAKLPELGHHRII